jgi:hypothetical protein
MNASCVELVLPILVQVPPVFVVPNKYKYAIGCTSLLSLKRICLTIIAMKIIQILYVCII